MENRLEELLSELPEIIKWRDKDDMLLGRLGLYYHKDRHYKWSALYYCVEYDFVLMCGYGKTPVEAVEHLNKLYGSAPKKFGVVLEH